MIRQVSFRRTRLISAFLRQPEHLLAEYSRPELPPSQTSFLVITVSNVFHDESSSLIDFACLVRIYPRNMSCCLSGRSFRSVGVSTCVQ